MRAHAFLGSIVLLLGADARAAQQAPLGSFVICPGNPRCPSGAATPAPDPSAPGISSTRGFSLSRGPGRRARAAPARPPDAAPPGRPASAEAAATILFDPNSLSLNAAARTQLDALATVLASTPQVRIVLEGHAAPISPPPDAVEIAARRAQAVADYLASRGIEPERMELLSWGSSQPAPGPDAGTLSRRVDIRPAD